MAHPYTIHLAAGPAAGAGASPPPPSIVERDLAQIEAVPGEVAQLPFLQQLTEVVPAADLLFGGTMLIFIVLVHAAGVRAVTSYVVRRTAAILARPRFWRADLLMSKMVFLLLSLHLWEIFLWTGALVYSGLVPDWRSAGFFAGNTYTTIGYGRFVLAQKWEMLAPIVAISGLFTFGWSGSVLVDLVARCQTIKEAAEARTDGR